jgi:hypothetical protein
MNLLKLHRLQNKFLHTTGNFPRCTPVCDLHAAFNLSYIYDYIKKVCRQQAEVIQTDENDMFAEKEQCEAKHKKYKRLKPGSIQAYDHSSD